jgi:hypothetical protein
MSRSSEAYQEQIEQENESGMSDYLHHGYTHIAVITKYNTRELKNEHSDINTRGLGPREITESVKPRPCQNISCSVHSKTTPF